MSNRFELTDFPHRMGHPSGDPRQLMEAAAWCVHTFGAAAYSLAYDSEAGLYLKAINPQGVWYSTGGAELAFKHASDLVLYKLTFG